MASSILHVKNSYYFDVPKALWRADYQSMEEFPEVWIRLDPEFQLWEARRLHAALQQPIAVPPWPELRDAYLSWRGEPGNFAKPLHRMLQEQYEQSRREYRHWLREADREDRSFEAYLQQVDPPHAWFSRAMAERAVTPWRQMRTAAGDVSEYRQTGAQWSEQKMAAYNYHLSGKVLIPQPPGVRLRNLHEVESGFAISQFLVIQFFVAVVLVVLFRWLAVRAAGGDPPHGRLWNVLELMLVYIRDNVARPTAGIHERDRFLPLLWTLFVFVLGCNLCGLLPWVHTPTASFGVTTGLAGVVFAVGVFVGMQRFGPLGFFVNRIPAMRLPIVLAVFIKPLLLALELVGLGIRHMVLAIRLLANMMAGHMVLLGIMGLAFGASGALLFAERPLWLWGGTAIAAVIASTLYMCLELFVAILQAFIFTFLSAVFISSAAHRH